MHACRSTLEDPTPRAVVVATGLAAHQDSIPRFIHGIHAARGDFDVMAVHAYGPPIWTAARLRGEAARGAMRAGADTRPLWLTEFGVDSAAMLRAWAIADPAAWDQRQRAEWSAVAAGNDASRLYDRLIGYVLFDTSDHGYGIVRGDTVTARPAYTWLQQRNR